VEQRRVWGKLTYAVSAIESLEHFRPIGVTLRFSGMSGAPEDAVFVVRCETAMLAAINLPVFGGRLGLRVPGVRTDDRLLDFIVVESPDPRGARTALEAALGALSGAAQTLWGVRGASGASGSPSAASVAERTHPVQAPAGVALPGARWFRARAVEIETDQPADLTLDGELRGRTPAVARVAPRPVQVIVPVARAV
jgi:diacylglycerol kinase family enzyme